MSNEQPTIEMIDVPGGQTSFQENNKKHHPDVRNIINQLDTFLSILNRTPNIPVSVSDAYNVFYYFITVMYTDPKIQQFIENWIKTNDSENAKMQIPYFKALYIIHATDPDKNTTYISLDEFKYLLQMGVMDGDLCKRVTGEDLPTPKLNPDELANLKARAGQNQGPMPGMENMDFTNMPGGSAPIFDIDPNKSPADLIDDIDGIINKN